MTVLSTVKPKFINCYKLCKLCYLVKYLLFRITSRYYTDDTSDECVFKLYYKYFVDKLAIMMDPEEVEFLAENRIISIIPNFTHDKIYLISGEFGPFRAGLPVNVPIWLAVMFKQKQKCRIVAPDWMDMEILEEIKEEEKRSRFFTKMPNEHYMVEAKLVLGVASEDIPRSNEIKTIIKDIWDIRMSKLRTSMDTLMKTGGSYGRLDHLTIMEINSVKPLLPEAMDELLRLQTMTMSKGNNSVNLNTSSFSQSGSSQH